MKWLNVDLRARGFLRGWKLVGAYMPEDGGPLWLLRFDSASGRGRAFARLDRGKHMLVDPLPQGVDLPKSAIGDVIGEVDEKVSRHAVHYVAAEEISAAAE